MPEFAGFVHTAAGAGSDGLVIKLYARNDHAGTSVADTTTNSNGYWAISHGTEGLFDVEVVIDDSNKYRIRYDDQIQCELGEFGQLYLRGTNDAFATKLVSTPTASRTITFPDATATALLGGYANTNSGVMSLTSTANSAAAVYLHANGGTSETVKIYSNQGTSVTEGAESINILSDDGGVGIRSTANLANAVNITVDGGTTSTMTLFNDQGTAATEGAASIQLLSDVGGINIKSGLDAADAILLTADGGTSEKIRIHADQGTGVDSIELSSDAGGIELNVGASVGITGNAIKDEDGMGSNSAIHLATQQSIKAYVDAQVDTVDTLAEVLAIGNASGGTGVVITAGDAFTVNTITETTGGSGVTIDSVLLKDNTVKAGTLTIGAGSITDSSGAIDFGNENLTTTGVITAAGFTIGSGAITEAELEILDGASVTTTELNLIDGGTARGTTAIADGDGVLINDDGTMRMTTVQTLAGYLDDEITAMPNLVTTGALTTGSIADGFGTINNGSNTITTTGAVATGALTVSAASGIGAINSLANFNVEGDLAAGVTQVGARIAPIFDGTTSGRGVQTVGTVQSGVTVASGIGLYVANMTGGTITEQYGIFMEDLTGGGSNYGVYQSGAAVVNVFKGDVHLDNEAALTLGKKLYFDGNGGHTYIYEESDDDLHIKVGNVSMIQLDQNLGAGQGSVGFGSAPNGRFAYTFSINGHVSDGGSTYSNGFLLNGGFTMESGHTAKYSHMMIDAAVTTQSASEDIGRISTLELNEPDITNSLGGSNVPDVTATLYVVDAPDVGTIKAAIYVASGAIIQKDTTASTSETTGSATFAGGIGVVGNSYFGDVTTHYRNDTLTTAQLEVEQDGTGDAAMRFRLTGAQSLYMGLDNSESDHFAIGWNTLGTSDSLTIDTSGGVYIGDDANGAMTVGLTINQGANDDQFFSAKSSDVGHGLTGNGLNVMETDTFYSMRKRAATGGVNIAAFDDTGTGNTRVYHVIAAGGDAATTDTATSASLMQFVIMDHDGSNGRANLGDTDNAFGIQTYNGGGFGTRFIVKGNGVIHVTNTTLVALDDEPDALIVRAMQKASSHSGIVEGEHDNPFYDYEWLKSKGLVGAIDPDGDGSFLFPIQNRFAAHEGAIWQNYTNHMSLAEKVDELEVELIEAKKQLAAISA